MNKYNVILTGVPRSGTTLICHLLNKLPDTVALHEPMDVFTFSRLKTRDAIRDEISAFFQMTRRSIKDCGTAISKHLGGQIPDNPVGDNYPNGRGRKSKTVRGIVSIDNQL